MTNKTAIIILAEGAEEMESVISVDVLRRAGITVTVAGLTSSDPITCSRGVVINPDTSLIEALEKGPYDAVVLPGGAGGAQLLSQSDVVGKLLKEQESSGRVIAAICAAPALVLVGHSIGINKKITCYPALKDKIPSEKYTFSEEDVVVDGELITSKGPGTSFDFALAVVQKFCTNDVYLKTKSAMLV